MMIRAVLDTNVFVSGIFWEGNYCSQIIEAWRAGKFTLISSIEIIQELTEILRDFKIEMNEKIIEEWRKMIVENAVVVLPAEKLALIERDPKDNPFFEAAIAGKADFIVSQDKKHILTIAQYKNIKTVDPEKFLELITSGDNAALTFS